MSDRIKAFFSRAAREHRATTLAGLLGTAAPVLVAFGQPQYAAIATAVALALTGLFAASSKPKDTSTTSEPTTPKE